MHVEIVDTLCNVHGILKALMSFALLQTFFLNDIYFLFKSGDEEVIEDCNEKICPSPGQWSEWGECSKSCGGGTRTKTRECINQRDSYGNPCNQDLVETEKCNENPCPIWTDWTDWTPCTVTCGGGTRKKARECVLPKSEAQVSKN